MEKPIKHVSLIILLRTFITKYLIDGHREPLRSRSYTPPMKMISLRLIGDRVGEFL